MITIRSDGVEAKFVPRRNNSLLSVKSDGCMKFASVPDRFRDSVMKLVEIGNVHVAVWQCIRMVEIESNDLVHLN